MVLYLFNKTKMKTKQNMKKFYVLLIAIIITASSSFAQVTVTGDGAGGSPYATLALAIAAVNGVGTLTQPTTITTSISETAPAGGYQITAIGTATNTLIISGGGNTYTASNAQVVGNLTDAVFMLIGADYVTIQNFIIAENAANTVSTPTANNNMTEWGIALLYATATNGAQNNTIQNNTISLDRTYANTFGIYSNVRHTATSASVTADITAVSGSNSSNKVYGNTINNVNYGIVFVGTGVAGGAAFIDNGNDIGGTSVTTGNTITNWGGLAVASSYISVTGNTSGIYINHQINDNVSFNTIVSATVTAAVTQVGIFKHYTSLEPTGTFTSIINNNSVTLTNNSSAAASGIIGINNQGLTKFLATSTMNINNNTIQNCTLGGTTVTTGNIVAINNLSLAGTLNMNNNVATNLAITATSSASGSLRGIINNAAAGTVNMNGNTVNGLARSAGTSGTVIGIYNLGAVVTTLNMNNNFIGTSTLGFMSYTYNGGTGVLLGLGSQAAAATCNTSIQNNDIRGISYSVGGTNNHQYITCTGTPLTNNVSNNTFTNITARTLGSVLFFAQSYTMPENGTQTFNNNSIVTAFNKTVANGAVTLFRTNGSSPDNTTATYTNNNFSNISVLGTSTITGLNNTDGTGSASTKTVTGNTFNNWTAVTGAIVGMNFTHIGAPSTSSLIANNSLTGYSNQAAISGITIGNTFGGTGALNLFNNSINNYTSSGTGGTVQGITCFNTASTINIYNHSINGFSSTAATVNGIVVSGATSTSVYKNNVYNLASSNTGGAVVTGIVLSGGTLTNTFNNFISDLRAPAASNAVAIYGINNSGGTTVKIYYNTVVLGKAAVLASSSTQFGVTGIGYSSGSNTSLINNIVWLDATPIGTAAIAAVRRSGAGTANTPPAATNYNASNNNILYVKLATGTAPVPANINKYLYLEGNVTTTATNGYGVDIGQADVVAQNLRSDINFNTTCGLYKIFMGIRENASFTEDNLTAGAGNTFVPSGSSYASNNAQVITTPTITDDYNAVTRNATTPDVGALEFSGPSIDAAGPSITYTALANTNCTSGPTLSATINDPSGVNVAAGTAPRLYYRKGGATAEADAFGTYPAQNTNAFNGWKYVEATGTAPNFSFAIDYSKLTSAMAVGDSLTYFVLAQDNNGTANVGKNQVTFSGMFCPASVDLSGITNTTSLTNGYRIIGFPTTQPAITAVGAGSVNNQVLRIDIPANQCGTLTQLDFSELSSASADISSARVYYTNTTTFATTTQFGADVVSPTGAYVVTGTQALSTTLPNYFWLVYDISCAAPATVGNTADASVTAATVSSVITVPLANQNPTGTRTINSFANYTTIANGEWSSAATWACGAIPPSSSTPVVIAHNVTVSDAVGNIAGNVTINAGSSLTVNTGGDLTLGNTGGDNVVLTNNGTLAVTGGVLNQNGSIVNSASSVFNQSDGDINIDGNAAGVTANSVASGVAMLQFNQVNSGINLTGGRLTIVDPHAATTSSNVIGVNNPTAGTQTSTVNHITRFGDGVSTDAGGNVAGFIVDPWTGTTYLSFGNIEINGGDVGANRNVTTAVQLAAVGDVTINANSTLSMTSTLIVGRDMLVNATGTYINTGGLALTTIGSNTTSVLTFAPSTLPQTITNNGIMANATTPTANLASFTVNNSNPIGVTINSPLDISGAFTMLSGRINTTTTNLLTLGFNATNVGSLTYTAGRINGPFKRWINAATGAIQFPIGNSALLHEANINFTTAPTSGGSLTALWVDGNPGFPNATPLTEGAIVNINQASSVGSWFVDAADGLAGGNYTAVYRPVNCQDILDYTQMVLIKRPSAGGDWVLDGTHVTTTGTNTAPVLSRTGMVGFSQFGIGGRSNITLPISVNYLRGNRVGSSHNLNWKVTCTTSPTATMVLERSADNRTYRAINSITADALRCNSPFDYVDASPLVGINYYRLRITDANGKVTYSNTIAMNNSKAGISIVNIAPNPVVNSATINIASAQNGTIRLVVTDVTGREWMVQNEDIIAGSNQIPLNVAKLAAGTYQITAITDDGTRMSLRFIKE
jgi:hypothetical protein